MTNQIQPNQYSPIVPLILDTNVIIHCLSNNLELGKSTRDFLSRLVGNNYHLSYNRITYYECVKTVMPARHQEFVEFLNIFRPFAIDDLDLQVSAELHNVYNYYSRNSGKTVMSASMSTEDILIAGTALLAGGHILTTNIKDFPAPFFKEIHREFITYEEKSIPKVIVIFLLVPDIPFIVDTNNDCFNLKEPNVKSTGNAKISS